MKILFLALLNLGVAFSNTEIDLIYSSEKVAEKLEYATIESVEYLGNHRYLVKTVNCKALVDLNLNDLKIQKATCWPL